jgi:putative membrane protein
VTDARPDAPAPDAGWNRLHPLTPIARVGRLAPALVLLLVVSNVHSKAENGTAETDYLIAITLISAIYGYIHWMVTRWRLEADTLRIETGLIRKDSRRLPLARIQAVDIVRPFLARLLGVSELRIRLAGSGSTDGKLAYLSEVQAAELRLVLLAGHIDAEAAESNNTGLPMASVDTGRLLGSVLLSLVTIIVIGTVAVLALLDQFEPKTAAALAGVLAVYLLSAAGVIWRRLSGQYAFIAVEAPEGVRIRRGLLQTISETVPYGRIQAVRQVEPLLWRPFGWCRLEVDVAGATSRNQRGEGTSVVRWDRSRTPGICWPGCWARPIPSARHRRRGPG